MSIPVITTANGPYEFDTDQFGLPVFTNKNLKLLEALLRYDSSYSASEDEKDPSAYAGMLAQKGVPTTLEDTLTIVASIDYYSSTHLASEGQGGGGKGREKTAQCIADIKDLRERLAKKDDGLVTEIAAAVEGENNYSFATKFCAYTCVFAKDIRSDNYPVYDSVVAEVLPYYAYLYAPDEVVQRWFGK